MCNILNGTWCNLLISALVFFPILVAVLEKTNKFLKECDLIGYGSYGR